MSNPIKFRVWSKSQSKWMSNIVLSAEGTPILLYSEKVDTRVFHRVFLIDVYEPVIQLSTGIKDKTGLEIYAGDKVRLSDERNGVVVYEDGTSYLTDYQDADNWTTIDYLDNLNPDSLQVIGNIFENAVVPTEDQPTAEEKKNEQSS